MCARQMCSLFEVSKIVSRVKAVYVEQARATATRPYGLAK